VLTVAAVQFCVSGGQTKQRVCTVGVDCIRPDACCPRCRGVCTGVPGPGPRQFKLATMVQTFGKVCGMQLIGCVTEVSEQGSGWVRLTA
jgi:hypothetical protein